MAALGWVYHESRMAEVKAPEKPEEAPGGGGGPGVSVRAGRTGGKTALLPSHSNEPAPVGNS